jgi:hypothetical protein
MPIFYLKQVVLLNSVCIFQVICITWSLLQIFQHLPVHLFLFSGAAKIGTDENVFNSIFASRSWPHLRQVMSEYHGMHGHTLEHAVMSEFSANAERGLLTICKFFQKAFISFLLYKYSL